MPEGVKGRLLVRLSGKQGVFLAAFGGLSAAALVWSSSSGGGSSADQVCTGDQLAAMVPVKGGTFIMGAEDGYADEGPPHSVTVGDFRISATEVTNDQFAEFVEATGYITVAERAPDPQQYPDIPPEQLKAGSAVFRLPSGEGGSISGNWQFIEGASWQHPGGPGSTLEGRGRYPAVHIAHADAEAYAKWKGHRLPTEAEFEYAARGALKGKRYAWGDDFMPGGTPQANTWQGFFPFQNSAEDGYAGTAPVGCFGANPYGAYDMIGNVWEWTSTRYFPSHAVPDSAPAEGFDPRQPGLPVRVIKGGSYLCAPNFCMRYRPAARHAQETGLGTNHIGFRTVIDETNPADAS